MARDPKFEAALALHRFGLGPREGSIAAIAGDARGALIEEMDRADAGRVDFRPKQNHGTYSSKRWRRLRPRKRGRRLHVRKAGRRRWRCC